MKFLVTVLKNHTLGYMSPKFHYYNWGARFLFGLLLTLLTITCPFLLFYYRSDDIFAFSDIMYIINHMNGGYIFSLLHFFNSTFIFLVFIFLLVALWRVTSANVQSLKKINNFIKLVSQSVRSALEVIIRIFFGADFPSEETIQLAAPIALFVAVMVYVLLATAFVLLTKSFWRRKIILLDEKFELFDAPDKETQYAQYLAVAAGATIGLFIIIFWVLLITGVYFNEGFGSLHFPRHGAGALWLKKWRAAFFLAGLLFNYTTALTACPLLLALVLSSGLTSYRRNTNNISDSTFFRLRVWPFLLLWCPIIIGHLTILLSTILYWAIIGSPF